MKIPALAFWLVLLAVARAPSASVLVQEMTVMTGFTEAVVAGQLQVLPSPGETGAAVALPVLLPRANAPNFAQAYAVAQPSLAVGRQIFQPAGFRHSDESLPGLPKGWQEVIFFFQVPPQFSGAGFVAKVMYIQPQSRDLVPFLPLSTPAASASKVTFLPGNSHSLELVSRNSQPAALENGMLTLRPRDRELILIRRLALREPERVNTDPKPPKRWRFAWKNPFGALFRRPEPAQPQATPAPSILPR